MATNKYYKLKSSQHYRFNEFFDANGFAAFNDKQFASGCLALGVTEKDIYSIGGGCFITKKASKELHQLMAAFDKEMAEAMATDTTGDGFLYEMLRYELDNHEYIITRDVTDALEALNLSMEEIKANPAMLHALRRAVNDIVRYNNEY